MPDRLHVSLRLKAARHLHGRVSNKGRAIPLPVAELAERQHLIDNGITANRIEEFEQMKTDARPMELEAIRQALELPAGWFGSGLVSGLSPESLRELLEQALDQLDQADAQDQPGNTTRPGDSGHQERASGGGAA